MSNLFPLCCLRLENTIVPGAPNTRPIAWCEALLVYKHSAFDVLLYISGLSQKFVQHVSRKVGDCVVLPLKSTWLAYSTSRTAVWQDNFRRALFVKPIFSLSKWGSTNGLNRRSISNFLWKWCSDLSNVAKGLWKGCPKGKNCIQVVPAFLERLNSQRRMQDQDTSCVDENFW